MDQFYTRDGYTLVAASENDVDTDEPLSVVRKALKMLAIHQHNGLRN